MKELSKLKLGKPNLESLDLKEMKNIKGGDDEVTVTIVETTFNNVSKSCTRVELYSVAEIDVEE